jgi:hypothetical protein
MLIKVFPHGISEGGKPTRYLVRMDYPGREENPPEVLRGEGRARNFVGQSFWARGYFVSTVDRDPDPPRKKMKNLVVFVKTNR